MNRATTAAMALLALGAIVFNSTQPADAAQRSSVKINASRHSILTGTAVTFTGYAAPKTIRTIRLQQIVRGKWSTVASHRTTKTGHYGFRWVVTKAGTNVYRVYMPTTRSAAAAASGRTSVLARRWHYLSDMQPVDDGYDFDTGAVEINGTRYMRSVTDPDVSTDEEYQDFNLSRKCVTFSGVLGIDDFDTGPSGSAQVEVGVDGNAIFSQNFALGQSAQVTQDITGHLRLRIDATSTNENDNVSAGWGNARVLCSF